MKLLTAGWWEGSEEGSYRSLRSLQDDKMWLQDDKRFQDDGVVVRGPIGRWRSLQDDRM